ncbi:cationic peroxidase 1-like [Iris pallida]|uniref:Cationic peroxidase 1-like n=1 Tax=Iris pallida TaxID=29817 RepID=A0AAX6I737_IRIPA|nr:cationic peroxidase 1-like [Iris pallida]
MVALSGAHTIGQAKCSSFRTHIYNETNIDTSFATSLKANCPSSGGDTNLVPLDCRPPPHSTTTTTRTWWPTRGCCTPIRSSSTELDGLSGLCLQHESGEVLQRLCERDGEDGQRQPSDGQ